MEQIRGAIGQWCRSNLEIVFLFYGLSFVVMGVAILAQPKKESEFKLAGILWLFVAYAFLHAPADFFSIWSMTKEETLHIPGQILTFTSYFFLFEFGRRLIGFTRKIVSWWILPVIAVSIIISSVVSGDFWITANILIGYFIRFPAGAMASLGFILYYRFQKKILKPLKVRKYFYGTAASVLAWSFFCGIVRAKGAFFPANYLNTDSFCLVTGLPVQVFRAICALIATWAICGMLKIFHWEEIRRLKEEIDKREIAEEQLRKSEEEYRHLFDNLSDAAFLADAESGRILRANKQAEVLLGRSLKEIIGMHQSQLHPPQKAEEYRQKFALHIQKGKAAHYDGEVIRKDGEVIPVAISASATVIAEKHLIIVLFRDITERKKIEESSRLAELGKLVSTMAHEVNNPLMIISGNAQLSLMEEIQGDAVKNNLKIIMEECLRTKDMIQRLLKFSRPSKGETKEVDINKSIEAVVGIVEHQFKLVNVEIKRNYLETLPLISVDEQQMQEVFMNFINNAVEAMPDGGVITITTSLEGDFLRIDFKDTGYGMSEEVKKKAFEPFFTTKEKGTGLGLSVCYGIIKAHNGEIKFESELNKGATVTVLLPLGG